MASDSDKELAETTAGCLLGLLSLPAVTAARGFALSSLWGWFVVPLGAPAVGFAHAAGLFLCVNVVAPGSGREAKTVEAKLARFGATLLHPFIILGLGYVARLCL